MLLSSYGWAESAIAEMKKVVSSLKNLEVVGEFSVKGPAYEEDLKVLDGLVDKLIEKIRDSGS